MATLYGGDILALVCSTWNISDASERPAYLGAIPITSGTRHRTHPRAPVARPEPRHETPGRCVAGFDPPGGTFGPQEPMEITRGDGPCGQRIARRKTRTQEGFTCLTHSSRISGPSPVWVATGLWMPDPRAGAARAKMAWASGIKPAF